MNPSPDERFEQVQSILNQLSNSQRHLLTAQVLMNDRLDRSEANLEKASESIKELAARQNQTESKLNALIDIVQRWYERHGNGSGDHQAS